MEQDKRLTEVHNKLTDIFGEYEHMGNKVNQEIFFLTFGQKSPARNGWIEVYAFDLQRARDLAFKEFGNNWSQVYYLKEFDKDLFPAGCLGVLK